MCFTQLMYVGDDIVARKGNYNQHVFDNCEINNSSLPTILTTPEEGPCNSLIV